MNRMIRKLLGLILVSSALMASDTWQEGGGTAIKPPFKVPTESDTIIRNSGQVATANGDLRLGFEVSRVIARHDTVSIHASTGELQPDVRLAMIQAGQLSNQINFKLFLRFTSTNALDLNKPFTIQVVSFNGVGINKTFTGQIGAWKRYETGLELPISLLRSGIYQGWANGQPNPPSPRTNELILRTDMMDHMVIDPATGEHGTASGDIHGYMAFGTIAPLIFIHGTAADQTSWEPGVWSQSSEDSVVAYLKDPNSSAYFPWEHRISLSVQAGAGVPLENVGGNGGIGHDASELKGKIPLVMKAFGAQSCHLIGHSKGGMASRQLVSDYYQELKNASNPMKILSVWTIGTPNKGTLLSDIAIQGKILPYCQADWIITGSWLDPAAYLRRILLGGSFGNKEIPRGNALEDQQTSKMVDRDNRLGKHPDVDLFYMAADADWWYETTNAIGCDNSISFNEAKELIDAWGKYQIAGATHIYRTLGWARSVNISYQIKNTPWFPVVMVDMQAIGDGSFLGNDMVTTVESARPTGGEMVTTDKPRDPRTGVFERGNHSSIKNGALVRSILNKIASMEKYQVVKCF